MYYDALQLEKYMSIAKPTDKNTMHTYKVVYDGHEITIDYEDIKKLYQAITDMEG